VEKLNYAGPIPDISYYGVNDMREEERRGENYLSGMRVRNPRLSTIGTFWNCRVKMRLRY